MVPTDLDQPPSESVAREPGESCEALKACRSCGGARLVPILDLGTTPLANRLPSADELEDDEPAFPLRLVYCPACALLQIDQTVHPEILFREYLYLSSFSPALLEHAEKHALRLIDSLKLGSGHLVVEAASNDGYLLKNFVSRQIPVLGIEPARNIAEVARERGIRTINEFFSAELAQELRADGTAADVFLANNVLAHVADLNGFVEGIKLLLAPEGRAVLEVPYAKDLLDHVEFDTIYHEHLCYFSLTALDRLFRRHGLTIVDAERIAIHGGSLRLTAAHTQAAQPTDRAIALLAEEKAWGVDHVDFYEGFGRRVEALKVALVDLLSSLRRDGKRIAGYGASAKGSTLLNYFGIGTETLDFVVDRNTYKQGRYTPGTHLPILPAEELTRRMPDYVLLLTWNFAEEILAQQAEYRRLGGKFIVPIPEVVIV